jgi:hypothetical protein
MRASSAGPALAVALAGVLLLGGCNRNVEPYVPGEQPREPDLAHIFPEEARGQDASRPMGAGMPPQSPRGAPPVAGESGEPIRGTVSVAPELAGAAPVGGVLFVIARSGDAPGPPLAVLRVPEPELPFEYEIGPDQVMIPGRPFAGAIRLSARLDRDGNASTRLPGDLEGELASPVAPGARDVAIVLDSRR